MQQDYHVQRAGRAKKVGGLYIPLLVTVVVALFAGCAKKTADGDFSGKTLNLYVAAGMKKPMDQVIQIFQEKTGALVAVNYGPSGGLYVQIGQDQPCDLYYSADWLYIEKLEHDKKTEKSRKFLNDVVVLVVSETGKDKIAGLDDLKKPGVSIAMADESAPIGVYSKNALVSLGLYEDVKSNIKAMPSTVNQVAILVKEDQVDAGLVYSSVANGNQLLKRTVIDTAHSGEVVFGSAIIKGGQYEIAKAFDEYAQDHVDIFEKYGWTSYE